MAENEEKGGAAVEEEEDSNYKAPAPRSVQEILAADKEDESLRKYKETLLGAAGDAVVIGSVPMVDMSITIKEGCQYRLKISFHVQREIVAGLKYVQKVQRHGIPVDKQEFMVGSYPPKAELQSYTTPVDEAPSGILHRGSYKVKSLFTDDDKHEWLSWEWKLEIKKDWD